ncbi:MAG: hypothetical protein FWG72_09895 [Oscillospiraceae bacterium]|nr:hypothetical protein [Oscillospiraceae bacterium]
MSLIACYSVDKDLYDQCEHHILFTLTEYTFNGDALIHLSIGPDGCERLKKRIKNLFPAVSDTQGDQFLTKECGPNSPAQLTTRALFEESLERFDISQTTIEREMLEDLEYTCKNGSPDKARVSVFEKGGKLEAVIEFRDTAQIRSFVRPSWFLPMFQPQ